MGVRNNNPAKVIWINACDGLLLLPQSSQIIQHMYSVHTAGQETTNANNATVRHSLTAVQSSWPVFVLSVNSIQLNSICMIACPCYSNNLHLVGCVLQCVLTGVICITRRFGSSTRTLMLDDAVSVSGAATPRPRTLTLCFTSLQVISWCS